MEEIHFVLTISDLLLCIGPLVVKIVDATLQTADAIGDYEQTVTNSASSSIDFKVDTQIDNLFV